MPVITLTKGKVALVDQRDFARINGMGHWQAQLTQTGAWYATRSTHLNGSNVFQRMHRVILQATNDQEVDHKNGNGLDNRRTNLRIASRSSNMQNRGVWGGSPYRGVSLHKATGKWVAQIQHNKTKKHLGLHDNDVDAAIAYDRAARDLYGPTARTNFVEVV